ncbi:ADP-ribosylglycohydrolase family protein [Treponema primitia ZAS-2]|uniref:ADP-ribosylglycohydrolase family protein n=1 Tax=Treponema primitia (strain ATCC BAA-887 / DSM 12427 / ZAS-2) TaxID=545694 RepID=F5YLX5_TREPZ|nr:ADP-ribosylglycohydrolase family protein [Treponema primitia]AEF85984.1 ADP-ribosylglycohydrolase family protein [Treponema primitia ZAS-2]
MQKQQAILGAIAGDVIGSTYEFSNVKSTDFELFTRETYFTDDSVMTIAAMDVLLNKLNYTETYQKYGRIYSKRGYGGNFEDWLYEDNPQPYNSWGNGSAMRASPIGWYCKSIQAVMEEAKKSAEVSHNHPEGIKGAQAVAAAVFLARTGKTKGEIKEFITKTFDYNLDRTLDEIRPDYKFEVSCQKSVPEAIIAFLESSDYKSAVRLAVSIGGDSDTIACISGAIAEAFYGEIPGEIFDTVSMIVGPDLMRGVIRPFSRKYGISEKG